MDEICSILTRSGLRAVLTGVCPESDSSGDQLAPDGVRPVLLPRGDPGAEEVRSARLEHRLRIHHQRPGVRAGQPAALLSGRRDPLGGAPVHHRSDTGGWRAVVL